MTEIEQLVDEIRDNINEPRKKHALIQDRASWMMLCSSMEVIEDTDCGLEAFLTKDCRCILMMVTSICMYMALYKRLVVQQDAVKHFHESLNIPHALTCDHKSVLGHIREIRNNSIGHPTKRDKN